MLLLALVTLLWAAGMGMKPDVLAGVRRTMLSNIEQWRWSSTSNYKVKIVSSDPLILHFEDFVTPSERLYLIRLS